MGGFMRRAFLSFMVAVVVGMLGSIPLADATGFGQLDGSRDSESRLVFVVSCGVVLFLLTLAVMAPVTRLAISLFAAVARAETRPKPPVAIGMMACGTLCVLSSLYLAWASRSVNPALDAIRSMQTTMTQGTNFNFNIPSEILQAKPSNGPVLLTTLVFVLGAGLVALGVWSSIGPVASTSLAMTKTPIPAADATSL